MARILITGCRGGIALDAAKRLAQKGHIVYATVHRSESIEPTKTAFLSCGLEARVFKLDILNEQDRQRAEGLSIDVLINNAAIGDSGPLADINIDRIRATFETNLFATLRLTQLVMEKMIARERGRILFVGSMAGLIPMPYLAPYNMTKFGLEGLVYALRQEVKPFNIDVVMINPGSYYTGFNQKNMMKKYEWMNANRYSSAYLEKIKKEERMLERIELKSTKSIAKQIVKAVQSNHPRKRYVAPLWQWIGVPILRLFK